MALRVLVFALLLYTGAAFSNSFGNDPWEAVSVPEWARELLLSLDTTDLPPAEQVAAPGCEYPVPRFKVGAGKAFFHAYEGKLTSPASSAKDLLSLVALNPQFLPMAQKFLELLEAKKVVVSLVNEQALASRSSTGSGAYCENYDLSRRLYLDHHKEIGLVTPAFLHELLHCIDDDADRESLATLSHMQRVVDRLASYIPPPKIGEANRPVAGLADLTPEQVLELKQMKRAVQQFEQIRIYRTERKAYHAEYELGKWMVSYFVSYYRDKGRVPASFLVPANDEHILKHHSIYAPWFELLQKGRCYVL